MLHILLLVLKIIGITLGILIGIIILAACLVLFLPLHYRIEVERREGEGNPPIEATAKVTWLLHLVNMRLWYSSELKLRLRVLFFTIFRLPAKEKKNSASKKSKKKNKEKNFEKKPDQPYKNKAEEKIENKSENIIKDDNADVNTENPDEENSEQKLSLKEKLKKIWEFFQNIWYTIRGLCDRIKGILENVEYYLDIIKGDTFESSFALCKDELCSIFSYIRPRTFKMDLVIGTGDPASTGQVLAYYYAVLYPLLGPQANVQGDFEQKRIEGTALIKGKIKLFTFIKAAIRIYFNKDIRKLLKLFKKEDE